MTTAAALRGADSMTWSPSVARRQLRRLRLWASLVAWLAFGSSTLAASPEEQFPTTGLISVHAAAGQRLLAEKGFLADYTDLQQHFEPQSGPTFCGVASSVVVLNALGQKTPLTQSTFFTARTDAVRTASQVASGGMTLGELSQLLTTHGATVTTYLAADSTLDAFRAIARQNLASRGDYLLINYQRAALGQGRSGHISPLAAYNASTDRFLILDVASYKYPPVWVSAAALWNAMNTLDSTSGRTRGFVVVRAER